MYQAMELFIVLVAAVVVIALGLIVAPVVLPFFGFAIVFLVIAGVLGGVGEILNAFHNWASNIHLWGKKKV